MNFMNFRRSGFRRSWPTLLAVVIGLIVAFIAAYQLRQYTNTHVETVRVPVPARDIPPYTVITSGDLTWRIVVKGGEEPGAIRDPSDAVGRLALSTLYKNEQIKKERLIDAKLVKDKQIVSVNVDIARSIGGSLQAGDLVDVWWVPADSSTEPGVGWMKIASNTIVLDVRDSSGKSVFQQGGVVQQALAGSIGVPATPPAVAILVVDSTEVPKIIGGASPKSQSIVLSKKFVPTEETVQAVEQPAEVQPTQTSQEQKGGKIGATTTGTSKAGNKR